MPAARELLLCIILSLCVLGCSRQPASPPAPHEAPAGGRSPSAERECVTFVDTVNEVLVEIERASARRGESENARRRDLAELAALYAKLARRVAGLKLEAAELRAFAREYQELIRKVQKTIKEVVQSLDADDIARAEQAQSDFVHTIELENDLVERINAFCETGKQTA